MYWGGQLVLKWKLFRYILTLIGMKYIKKTSPWIFLQCHSYLDISSTVHSLHHLSLNLSASEVTGCVKSLGAADLRGKLPTQNQGQCQNTSAHYSLRKYQIDCDQKDIAKVKEIWSTCFQCKKRVLWRVYKPTLQISSWSDLMQNSLL